MRLLLDITGTATEDRIEIRAFLDEDGDETSLDGSLLLTGYELAKLIAALASADIEPTFAIRACGEILV